MNTGDYIEVAGQRYVIESALHYNPMNEANPANEVPFVLRRAPRLCGACNENPVHDEMDETWAFCPRCLEDAQVYVLLSEMLATGLGEDDEGIMRILQVDNEEIARASKTSTQYIDLLSSAKDMFSAMPHNERCAAIAGFIDRHILPRVSR